MIRRLAWLLVGAAGALWAARRLGLVTASPSDLAGRAGRALGARAGEGVTAGAGAALEAARSFGADVRRHAAAREAELREAVAPAEDDATLGGHAAGHAGDDTAVHTADRAADHAGRHAAGRGERVVVLHEPQDDRQAARSR